jgi:hypothetical protein
MTGYLPFCCHEPEITKDVMQRTIKASWEAGMLKNGLEFAEAEMVEEGRILANFVIRGFLDEMISRCPEEITKDDLVRFREMFAEKADDVDEGPTPPKS